MAEEIARRQRGMTPIRFTLAAGVPRTWNIDGDYFHVYETSLNDLIVRFDNGEPISVAQGVGFRRYYGEISLESATGGAVVAMAGFGSVADSRASANVNTTVNVSPGNTNDDGGDVLINAGSSAQLIGADATRLYILITNPSTNTATFRIGSAAVGATSGTPLEPGTTLPWASTAATYAYNTGGVAESLSVSAIREV